MPAWAVLSLRTRRLPSPATLVLLAAVLAYTLLTTDAGEWLRNGLPAMTSGNFTFYNWSLSTFPLRYIASGEHLLAPPFRTYLSVMSLVAPLAVAVLARRSSPRLHTTLVLLASTAFAPLCWWYRLPIGLLLVFASGIRRRAHRTPARARAARPPRRPDQRRASRQGRIGVARMSISVMSRKAASRRPGGTASSHQSMPAWSYVCWMSRVSEV